MYIMKNIVNSKLYYNSVLCITYCAYVYNT